MRRLQTAILVLMVALMPLRTFAAATMPLWADDGQDRAMQHEGGCHQDEGGAPADSGHKSGCTDHGCCAAFLAPATAEIAAGSPRTPRIGCNAMPHAGFVPEHLDPPPVAL